MASSLLRLAVCLSFITLFSSHVTSNPVIMRNNACSPPIRLIYQFPNNTGIENMVVRSNGQLLITLLSSPELYLVDPFQYPPRPPTLVHTFPNALGLTGIAEITPDNFIVASTNYSLRTGNVTPNSSIAWRVNLDGGLPTAISNYTRLSMTPPTTKITNLNKMIFPNGLCMLNTFQHSILIGDIKAGKIFRLDTDTGKYTSVINNFLTKPYPNPIFGNAGVNGIKVKNHTIYYTNTGGETFNRGPINIDGTMAGDTGIITHAMEGQYFDDFVVRGNYAYLVSGSANSIVRASLDGTGREKIIVGGLNSTLLAEPTAIAFGRTDLDGEIMYVVTAGGLATPVVVGGEEMQLGGQVVAIDLDGCWA